MSMLKDMWSQITQYLYAGSELTCADLPKSTCNSTIPSGQCIDSSVELCSEKKRAKLSMRSKGALIVSTNTYPVQQMWSNNVTGAVKACMLSNGNFVLYNSNNDVIWSTNTTGFPGATLKVDDDFNFNIEQNGAVVYTSNPYNQVTSKKFSAKIF